jgi:hydrogenase maturation factor
MHDPTEGGFLGGLDEICRLARLEASADKERVPVHAYTKRAAARLGFDPLRLVASGSLMAVIREDKSRGAERAFGDSPTPLTRVGIFEDRVFRSEGRPAPREELWGLLRRPRVG